MYSSESDDDGNPCSDQCYLRVWPFPFRSLILLYLLLYLHLSSLEESSKHSLSVVSGLLEGCIKDCPLKLFWSHLLSDC